ncbi:DUF58 domain-containing protein [Haloferula chungangensis]|uniref:DUF58 domain-containing protein n=1 Tax=Haloferula chungangensis TaxID=1048331 RepID=A0ABW2L9D1_9BACT
MTDLADPEVYLAIEDLELAADGIVNGIWQGYRRSPYRGSGVEFESHRDYRPGDDPRHVNWAMHARHRRLCVKEYRTETNLPLYLLLDASGSMSVANGPSNKFHYAARATAALARLAHDNRDSTSLLILREEVDFALPSRSGTRHFQSMLATLQQCEPSGAGDLARALEKSLDYCRHRGLIVLFSDLFSPEDDTLRALRCLREQGHEVIVFQILDPLEHELPDAADLEFEDAETGRILRTSAGAIRQEYAMSVARWRAGMEHLCQTSGVDWVTCSTADPLSEVVAGFLHHRSN